MISIDWIVRPRAVQSSNRDSDHRTVAAPRCVLPRSWLQGPLVHNFADHVMAGFDFSHLTKMLAIASAKLS